MNRAGIRLFAVLVGIAALPPYVAATEASPAAPPRELVWELPEPLVKQARRADRAYEAGDYGRALRIYRDSLAPAGDKYAQYMVGWMLLQGEGAQQDPVSGVAWLALASERGHPELVAAYEEAAARLGPTDRDAAGDLARALVDRHGDCALLRQAHGVDEATYQKLTGSRVGATQSGPLTVMGPYGDPRENPFVTARKIRKRQGLRIDYLNAHCQPAAAGEERPAP